jgi:MarR family transcriptional regulator, organic hydroperoxide resistance regulator
MDVAANPSEMLVHEESLVELLDRANHLLAESLYQQVKWQGLSVTEWRVLAALNSRDGTAMTELAELVRFKQPTLTKAIDRMERVQLVRRHTPTDDRRRTLVYLTERGRRIAAPLVMRAHQHEAAVTNSLGKGASRDLKKALATLIDQVAQLPREQPPRGARVPLGAVGD